MEPPVSRILIFSLATCAHGKSLHGGILPVVWGIFNYCVTRPAVGTVDERISVSSISGIQHLPQAVPADRDVRGYKGGKSILSILFAMANLLKFLTGTVLDDISVINA